MVDAWEIFGRLATSDAFRDEVFKGAFNTPYPVDAKMRSSIPGTDYDTALAIVRKTVIGRPVALMALGELLMSLTNARFRRALVALADAIKGTHITVDGRDSNFHTALGAMIIDDQLRAHLQASGQNFDKYGFTSVQPADRADLQAIFNPATSQGKTVIGRANDTCDSFWEPGCHLKTIFWGGHTHPVANP